MHSIDNRYYLVVLYVKAIVLRSTIRRESKRLTTSPNLSKFFHSAQNGKGLIRSENKIYSYTIRTITQETIGTKSAAIKEDDDVLSFLSHLFKKINWIS